MDFKIALWVVADGANLGSLFAYNNVTAVTAFPNLDFAPFENFCSFNIAGESQARNKYTYFASVAKKQGFEQIADLFLKTADNEKEHAKMWFKEPVIRLQKQPQGSFLSVFPNTLLF